MPVQTHEEAQGPSALADPGVMYFDADVAALFAASLILLGTLVQAARDSDGSWGVVRRRLFSPEVTAWAMLTVGAVILVWVAAQDLNAEFFWIITAAVVIVVILGVLLRFTSSRAAKGDVGRAGTAATTPTVSCQLIVRPVDSRRPAFIGGMGWGVAIACVAVLARRRGR